MVKKNLVYNYFEIQNFKNSVVWVGNIFFRFRVVTPNSGDTILNKTFRGLQHFKIISLDNTTQYPTYGVFLHIIPLTPII